MIEFLRSWVTNIVILVVFISFLEIILPSSNMKRYINMIIGLLIIIVIINPFINLMTKDINIEREVFKNILKSKDVGGDDKKDLNKIQEKQVINLYKGTLKDEIINAISTDDGYKIVDIELEINEDRQDKEYGMVKEIKMIISENNSTKEHDNSIKVNKVKEVSVEVLSRTNSDDTKKQDDFEYIKEIISKQYSIPKEKIHISMNS